MEMGMGAAKNSQKDGKKTSEIERKLKVTNNARKWKIKTLRI